MNQKRKYSIFLILLAMIIPLFANFVPQKHVYAEGSTDINAYYGTAHKTTAKIADDNGTIYSLMDVLRIQYPNQPDAELVAYCIELDKAFPKPNDQINYQGNGYDIEEAPTEEYEKIGASFNRPRENSVVATIGVRNALYRGYPIDADNIQEKYQLTNDEFWHLTQMAIHYWTDTAYNQLGNPFTKYSPPEYGKYNELRKTKQGLPDLAEAYDHLIGKGNGHMSQAPNDMQLLQFIPQNNQTQGGYNYQRMVSAYFKERQIKFKKVDDNNAPIGNVEFKIKRISDFLQTLPMLHLNYNKEDYTFVTGNDGNIETISSGIKYDGTSLALIFGEYELTEINTPNGYQGLSKPIKFSITHNGEIQFNDKDHPDYNKISFEYIKSDGNGVYLPTVKGVEIKVVNKKKGFDFKFKKTDNNGKPLNGAIFDILKKEDNTVVTSFTSDEQGTYKSVILPEGNYILKESATPDTYQTMPELEFGVSNQGGLSFTNQELAEKYVTTQNDSEKKYDIKNIPKIKEPKVTIKTQVEVGEEKSEKDTPVMVKMDEDTKTISFKDYLTYDGLVEGEEYVINSYLYEKHPDGSEVENIGKYDEMFKKWVPITITAKKGPQTIPISFNNVTIKPGVKYVVMAKIQSNNEIEFADETKIHTINHNDKDDDLQTFITVVKQPLAEISTVVEVNGNRSTKEMPVKLEIATDQTRLDVKDYLYYSNLIAGKNYVITAYLWEIKSNGQEVNPILDLVNKVRTKEFTAKAEGGTEEIIFPNVELNAGSKYVVTETIISKDKFPFEEGIANHMLDHNMDKQAKAQTFEIHKVPQQTLTIEKKVTGFSGNKQKEFTFDLTVNPDQYLTDGNKLMAKLHRKGGQVTKEEITVGKQYTFKLKDGEHLEVQGLYENTTYTLNEVEFGQDGYETTVTVNDQPKADAQINAIYKIMKNDNKVVFTNHNGKIIPTGILLDSTPYLTGVVFVTFLGIVLLISSRRKKLK